MKTTSPSPPPKPSRYSSLTDSETLLASPGYAGFANPRSPGLVSPRLHGDAYDDGEEFNPYEEVGAVRRASSSAPSYMYDELHRMQGEEVGYGGGSWTHEDIAAREKARLKKQDMEMGIIEEDRESEVGFDTEELERRDVKSAAGPITSTRQPEIEELPRYTSSEPPPRH